MTAVDLRTRRTAAGLVVMIEWAVQLGMTPEQCTAGTRTNLPALRRPNAEVSRRQELRVIENIVAAVGDQPGLGLDIASRYPVTAYGVWGFALLTSRTLREAVDVGVRFVRLTAAFSTFELREGDHEVVLVIEARAVPDSVRRFVLERDVAGVAVLTREIFGATLRPSRLAFALSHPGAAITAYEKMFGAIPDFDAAETVIAFTSEQSNAPLPQASPHTARLAEQQCRTLLERRESRVGRAGQVRDLLLSNPADPPDLEQVADRLSTSTRTLRRQLESEGTSLRKLLDEVRELLAVELLQSGMSVEQVSNRLGYSNISNFSHAFSRWKGMSPRAYLASRVRKSHAQSASRSSR